MEETEQWKWRKLGKRGYESGGNGRSGGNGVRGGSRSGGNGRNEVEEEGIEVEEMGK